MWGWDNITRTKRDGPSWAVHDFDYERWPASRITRSAANEILREKGYPSG